MRNKTGSKFPKGKDIKDILSRNSLQARKNNYNPVFMGSKKKQNIVQIDSYGKKKISFTSKKPQSRGINTFESIWSAYTDHEYMQMINQKEKHKNE